MGRSAPRRAHDLGGTMVPSNPKYFHQNETYFNYVKTMEKEIPNFSDMDYFSVYVGAATIARFLALYDIYKMVIGLTGHIADIGTYRGSSLLFFAKLIKMMEPNSPTRAFGFDWFKGMTEGVNDHASIGEECIAGSSDYDTLMRLITLQGYEGICTVNKLDLRTDLAGYFADKPWLRFKLCFLDCALAEVMESSLQHFWPRLVNGGILIVDHYNSPVSPAESGIVEKYIGKLEVRQFPYTRYPYYIIKK